MVAVAIDHRQALPRDRRGRATPAGRGRVPSSRGPHVGGGPHPAAARRLALVGVFAALFVACAVWVQAGAAGRAGNGPLAGPGAGPSRPAAADVWVVQPGDTLWAIAHHVQPTGDIRPLVDRLEAEVHGRPLQVGEQLVLP